jgi:DNA-binding transcriptional regulator LsrR (DeoR family)
MMGDERAIDLTLRRKTLAYLMADQNLNEQQAAARLDGKFGRYTVATAARDFKEAKRQGWYRAVFAAEACSPDELRAIEVYAHSNETLEAELKRESSSVLQQLRVFPGGLASEPGDSVAWGEALELFGRRASGYVLDTLASSKVIGVGWGHTMAEIIEGVQARRNGRGRSTAPIIVLPTAGEPLGEGPSSRSSSALAARLHRSIGGDKRYSLHGVPPVIPEEFQDQKRATVLDFIGHLRSYREIFGNPSMPHTEGLINNVDTLLTSAGCFHSWMMYKNELVAIGGIASEQLLELCVGDIGGVLIPRAGLSRSGEKEFRRISSLWTGITLEHIQRIANAQGGRHSGPGVVLCACGSNKAEIVHDLVTRMRIVNVLVVDDALAAALAEMSQ